MFKSADHLAESHLGQVVVHRTFTKLSEAFISPSKQAVSVIERVIFPNNPFYSRRQSDYI